MTETHDHRTTLVLGGTGKTGRRVVERLGALGLRTRVGSRSGEPPFDWQYRSTCGRALDRVEQVYFSYYPDLAVPGAVETVGSLAELAVTNRARRLVLLPGAARPRRSKPRRPCGTYLFSEVLDGRNAHVTDGVRRALGRDPRDFTEFARRAVASGVWTLPTVGV
jgi:hypothetical protein